MKTAFKIAAFLLLVLTIVLYLLVRRDGNYHFDQHGFYTGPDGILHRESVSENHFFLFLLSAVLLLVTTILSFNKSRVRPRLK